jgi:hypothetical protein
VADRREEEERAALQLEAQVGSLLAGRQAALQPTAVADMPQGKTGAGPRELSAVPTADALPPVVPAPASESGQAIEAILTKLRAGGLFGGLEGSLFLSDGRTEARIVRLTNGKMAIVLPRFESGDYLARQLKRFDLCIIPLGGDQVCVVSPLGTLIAERFSL